MSNLTINTPSTGPKVIQGQDFYQHASILHPIIVGTMILALTFGYLRLSSNRSVAPMTLFDGLVSVAMGSTLAGVINGTALVRGILALLVLMWWQFMTSFLCTKFPKSLGKLLSPQPLCLAFRGEMLQKVMEHHRVAPDDLYSALRVKGVWHLCEVELAVIEPNGQFSIYLRKNFPTDYEPTLLLDIPGYKKLREHEDECKDTADCDEGKCEKKNAAGENADQVAMEAA